MQGKWCAGASAFVLAALALPNAAQAQRVSENAVTSADDAFGSNVGTETTGIYTENDTRGFSPLKAGNARLDGIYFDPVASISIRLRTGNAIRVGFAAIDYPFPAPTGIVDSRLRTAGDQFIASVALTSAPYGGWMAETDMQVPVFADHLSIALGTSYGKMHVVDGSSFRAFTVLVKPVIRFGGVEVSPFFSLGTSRKSLARPLVVLTGPFVPALPAKEHYFGQDWAQIAQDGINAGTTVKAKLSDRLSLRGGIFYSGGKRLASFAEIFAVIDPSGLASHRLIADPLQDLHSWSGEAQIAWRLGGERFVHRLIAGYRKRDRHTETGGSDSRDFGLVILGEPDPEPQPDFNFTPVSVGRVRQSSWMLGYLGTFTGIGQVNLGIQRADYRADFHDTVQTTSAGDKAWLYNASVAVNLTKSLSVFAGTERGLEDSGAAPENAANRLEQLPATRTTQYEGGVRWKHGGKQLVLSAFQITKPYFAFDGARRFVDVGQVRHRGIEASLSGQFGKRLHLLAGAVVMDPKVSRSDPAAGLAGERPTGTPSLYARIDANYRTDIFGGLTPTVSFTYTGRRAAGSPLAGVQMMLPAHPTLDLGVRQQFKVGRIPASIRAVLMNLFDDAAWKVIANNTLQPDDRRRILVTLSADF